MHELKVARSWVTAPLGWWGNCGLNKNGWCVQKRRVSTGSLGSYAATYVGFRPYTPHTLNFDQIPSGLTSIPDSMTFAKFSYIIKENDRNIGHFDRHSTSRRDGGKKLCQHRTFQIHLISLFCMKLREQIMLRSHLTDSSSSLSSLYL